MEYNYAEIEKKWQKYWVEHKSGRAVTGSDKPKFYGLIEFPYPSGQGLHVGHTRPFTAMDVICRRKRMQGYNVLFPIGYDAFGLPTENYAIKNHVHPSIVTKQNIANFEKQLHMLGYSFDWDRVVDTTDPEYYKWTQWIFLRMYKKGLAYKASMPVNWCTSCKCVLANEEVVDGVCERCGSPVVRREKSQWMLAITKYADRLIDDLDDVDFIPRVKTQQRNWIGRSEGAELTFGTTLGDSLTVYTTRGDTLFGVTYMVLSPEHPILDTWKDKLTNWDAVAAYREEALRVKDRYPEWESGIDVKAGERYRVEDILWECIKDHATQDNWKPGTATLSLWKRVDAEGHAGTMEDPIPYTQNMALEFNKYYTQDGILYLCIQAMTPGPYDLKDVPAHAQPIKR